MVIMAYALVMFQFTHPGKGATNERVRIYAYVTFQFTHPGKGATIAPFSRPSITRPFQFTHPGKGATALVSSSTAIIAVSIHAPWEGCDAEKEKILNRLQRVSIHAPWEGCDAYVVAYAFWLVCFNSRTLGRVRLCKN